MSLLQIRLCVGAILLSNIVINIATGMTSVLFPVTLEEKGLNTTFIGVILAMEFLAILPISKWLVPIIGRIGMVKTLVVGSALRVLAVMLFYEQNDMHVWGGLVFTYGVGSFIYLVALQSWINSLELKNNRGLVTGLFGTAISAGVAIGPLFFQFIPVQGKLPFLISAGISAAAAVPLIFVSIFSPKVPVKKTPKLWGIIKRAPAVMGAGVFIGVMLFGLWSFLVIYGLQNKLTAPEAAFLLTVFMTGSILLETPIATISDRFDRRYIIIISVFLCLVCATYLPIAIYTNYLSWALLFLWGGVSGSIYSMCLALIGERFADEELVAANSAFSLMDAIGGMIGTALIGVSMSLFGADGLPYVIVLAGIVYFTYALTRYRVE